MSWCGEVVRALEDRPYAIVNCIFLVKEPEGEIRIRIKCEARSNTRCQRNSKGTRWRRSRSICVYFFCSIFLLDKGWVLRLALGVFTPKDPAFYQLGLDENQENGMIIETIHSHSLDYSFSKGPTPVMLIANRS